MAGFMVWPSWDGEAATTKGTPAAFAVAMLMMAEAACAKRPPGI